MKKLVLGYIGKAKDFKIENCIIMGKVESKKEQPKK